MNFTLEVLNNAPNLDNEPIAPAQLSERLQKYQMKNKILTQDMYLSEESDLAMNLSAI